LIEKALSAAPGKIELLLHAAIVHAALNDLPKARERLLAAEKIDPKVGERPEVKSLRARLKLDDGTLVPAP
jgi:hypothetical protein